MFGGGFSFSKCFVVGNEDAFADVYGGLTSVGGVGFSDVDDEEFGF